MPKGRLSKAERNARYRELRSLDVPRAIAIRMRDWRRDHYNNGLTTARLAFYRHDHS